jgi:hypothetical protein
MRDDEHVDGIEVDLPDVLTDGGALLKTLDEAGVSFRLKDVRGPGGGNPRVHLSGARNSVRAWLLEHYCPGEPDEVDFVMGSGAHAEGPRVSEDLVLDTWASDGDCIDTLTIKPQYSGIWVTFDFGHYGEVEVSVGVTADLLGEEFVDVRIRHPSDGNPRYERVYAQRPGVHEFPRNYAEGSWPAMDFALALAGLEAEDSMDGSDLREFFAYEQAPDYIDLDLEDVADFCRSLEDEYPELVARVRKHLASCGVPAGVVDEE